MKIKEVSKHELRVSTESSTWENSKRRQLAIEMCEWQPKTFEECMQVHVTPTYIQNQVRSKHGVK